VDRFCFRSLPAHRQGLGWEEAEYQSLSSSYWRVPWSRNAVAKYETVIYYGAIDPRCIPALMMQKSLARGQRTFLVSEGIRYQHPRWRSFAFSALLNSTNLEILAIGHRSAEDYRNAGLVKPTYRKFGFFENYPPIDTKTFSHQNESEAPVHILSVGQLIDRKNFLCIIKSLQRLASKTTAHVIYTICGEGVQRQEIEAEIQKLPKHIEVRLLGNCKAEQLDQCFRCADIFAMPSTYDGWGAVLNQAVHFQLPIVVSSGVRAAQDHLVEHNFNGYIFASDAELDAQLLELITNGQQRAKFYNNSVEIASAWHIDTVATNLALVVGGKEPILQNSFAPLVKV